MLNEKINWFTVVCIACTVFVVSGLAVCIRSVIAAKKKMNELKKQMK